MTKINVEGIMELWHFSEAAIKTFSRVSFRFGSVLSASFHRLIQNNMSFRFNGFLPFAFTFLFLPIRVSSAAEMHRNRKFDDTKRFIMLAFYRLAQSLVDGFK